LALGLLAQGLVKLMTAQKIPPWPLNGVRLGGAVVAGWLVALWLFGGGGGGLGGTGGGLFGGGKDRGKGDGIVPGKEAPGPPKKADKGGPAAKKGVLPVEVLTNDAARRDGGSEAARKAAWYRLEGAEKNDLRTLGEIEKQMDEAKPPLKGLVILLRGDDNPARPAGRVQDLARAAEQRGLKVEYITP
jgi:hypothetical protein